ncbi:MAG: alpha/beta fold hydrolase [Candidatus Peribacteraceae bacterium]|nr:alpha/beta fold hydrolase [Candidatus Peribacteraceae bacterium]
MKKFLPLLILLSACAASPAAPMQNGEEEKLQEPVQEEDQPLLQVPDELSIASFRGMRLSGTGLTLTNVLAQDAAYTRYGITYLSNGLLISGILNIPKGEGPFPLVILNHGYISPTVYTQGRGLKREQDSLARNGFAVLHTDYRGHALSDPSPDTRMVYDAGLEYAMDSANAILAVRAAALPQVDARRVGMLGHSLGGGVTLNVAVAKPDLIDAAVLYAPVHSDAYENFVRWRSQREEGDRTREALGTRAENPQAWDALSSLTYLKDIDVPVLLFHGTNDADVPIGWSDFLAKRLRIEEKDVTYVVYQGEQHEFIPQWNDFMAQTAAFLQEHLRAPDVWVAPLTRAEERVTKKPFGREITPTDSPVQPERFTGYHTGTDFELLPGEEARDIVVQAICAGPLLARRTVSGYGGVAVQQCTLDGAAVTGLYGHLNLDSIAAATGQRLAAGERIGTLGAGFTAQTDGERPHLHLSIHRGSSIDLRGYVQTEVQLAQWVDPMRVLSRSSANAAPSF